MSQPRLTAAVRRLRDVLIAGDGEARSDADLLRAFAADRDADAFAALVGRYRGLVLNACRRVLGHEQDAEDACQATFLVLAKKAAGVRHGESLPAWLHGTARRIALRARRESGRRRAREGKAAHAPICDPTDELTWREVRDALDEEIDRLPPTYRGTFLLCCVEGVSHAEAARRLGIAEGSVASRLTRARHRLHERLKQRGIELSAVLGVIAVGSMASAAASRAWVEATVAGALAYSSGGASRAGLSGTVLDLAEGASRTMGSTPFKLKAVVLLTLATACAGVLLANHNTTEPPRQPAAQPQATTNQPAADKPEADFTYRGKVLNPDGKPVKGAKVYFGYPRADRSFAERTVTDAEGRFEFTMRKQDFDTSTHAEPWALATVIAAAPGFGPARVRAGDPADAANLSLRLAPDILVKGRIVDLQGNPVEGVKVSVGLMHYAIDREGRTVPYNTPLEEVHSGGNLNIGPLVPPVVSDKEGRFEIRGLGRDRLFHLILRGREIETCAVRLDTRVAKQPPVLPQKGGAGGDDGPVWKLYGTDIVHIAKPARPIVGVVLDRETGKPIPKVTLNRTNVRDGGPGARAETDAKGRYELLGLPPAEEYEFQVTPPRGSAYESTTVRVRGDQHVLTPLTFDIKLNARK